LEITPFPNTHWSLVRRAGVADQSARRHALGVLLRRYEPSLRSYLRATRRMRADEAEELLQSFIADRLLEADLLAKADAQRGRFRGFLITSLRNYVNSHNRQKRAHRTESFENSANCDNSPSGEHVYEAEWARALINDVLRSMKAHCHLTGKQNVWIIFEERVIQEVFREDPPTSYADLARRLNLTSPSQAANLLVTAKRMYSRFLRSAVAEYEMNDTDIDAEIIALRKHLAVPTPITDE
jgi:hypothetical protein